MLEKLWRGKNGLRQKNHDNWKLQLRWGLCPFIIVIVIHICWYGREITLYYFSAILYQLLNINYNMDDPFEQALSTLMLIHL